LHHIDPLIANKELTALEQLSLIKQHRTKRWAYYSLNSSAETSVSHPPQTAEGKIIEYVRQYGSINNEECRALLSVNLQKASNLLKKMKKQGVLFRKGERRWARYYLL